PPLPRASDPGPGPPAAGPVDLVAARVAQAAGRAESEARAGRYSPELPPHLPLRERLFPRRSHDFLAARNAPCEGSRESPTRCPAAGYSDFDQSSRLLESRRCPDFRSEHWSAATGKIPPIRRSHFVSRARSGRRSPY